MPGAFGRAFDNPDGEDVEMPGRDLECVAMMVEKLWMATVEDDVNRGMSAAFRIGHRPGLLEERFTHSCATNLA